ncbi:MAG TPA: hypothetical protein VF110_05955, partial [Burkholderiales bacterium]
MAAGVERLDCLDKVSVNDWIRVRHILSEMIQKAVAVIWLRRPGADDLVPALGDSVEGPVRVAPILPRHDHALDDALPQSLVHEFVDSIG